mgnify:CR=1 FL=1
MNTKNNNFTSLLHDTLQVSQNILENFQPELKATEVGTVDFVGEGIARIFGLPTVQSDELIRFPGNLLGIAFNLDPDQVGVVLLDKSEYIKVGSQVQRTHEVMNVPVGEALMGRVVDAIGRPLDEKGALRTSEQRPVEQPAPAIMDRDPVEVPLQTGLKVVDALIPIGRGQRELIVGDRQTGKTAIALDTIINQHDKNVICIYCAIGQKSSDVARFIATLRDHGAMDYSVIVIANGEDPPGMQFIAPYAATSMAEYFRDQGKDVLVVYDDLTSHARAYRQLSLLLRRPPAREAYPGDIFYIHSRLLERSTHLKESLGGGSLTALPVVETQAQNISAYIPTNLISITDGQIYVSPDLYRKGVLPAVDVGKSVSRVGGKTQLKAYRDVASDLRLSYSQFEELETFARFSTRLDEETQKTLERGRRVREILKQPQYQPISAPEQIAVLIAITEGLFDVLDVEEIEDASRKVREAVTDELPDLCDKIESGEELTEEGRKQLTDMIREVLHLEEQVDQDADA